MWLKICLTNKYFAKRDFRQEIVMARALVKNKVGKMRLF